MHNGSLLGDHGRGRRGGEAGEDVQFLPEPFLEFLSPTHSGMVADASDRRLRFSQAFRDGLDGIAGKGDEHIPHTNNVDQQFLEGVEVGLGVRSREGLGDESQIVEESLQKGKDTGRWRDKVVQGQRGT